LELNNKKGPAEMASLSNAEAALLGLLSEEPMHPYRIEKEVKYRDMRFWTELSMSSIYKLLRKLEKQGFVSRKNKITGQNRLCKLYSVADKGKKALRQKLTALLSEPEHIRWQVDIGTYNCDLLSAKELSGALARYRAKLEEKIKGYKALHKFLQSAGCPSHRFAVALRPVFLLKAEIKWIDSCCSRIKRRTS
jgi:DNA-binding PadR family transcriptional regulator